MEYIQVDPYHLKYEDISSVVNTLKSGGIIIFPTDSVYALGCLLSNKKGIQRIIKLSQKAEKKSNMSLFFTDLKSIASYTQHYNNSIYRAVNRFTPGPYTFIFNASKTVTKSFENNKKEVGIRLPKHPTLQAILDALDEPLISTSLNGDRFDRYDYNLESIAEDFKHDIDLILDDGIINRDQTTVLDCTGEEILLVREGIGPV